MEIKPCKIDHDKYVMKLNKIEQICTFKQIISIDFEPSNNEKYEGWITILKRFGNSQTRKISYQIPKGLSKIVKQRLRELILMYLTDDPC